MQIDDIKQAILAKISDAQMELSMEGNHLHATIVSTHFEGLNAVKRQQLVYSALNEYIASGDVHAVHMKTATPAELA